MKLGFTTVLLSLVAVVTSMAQGARQESVGKQKSAKTPQSTPTVDQIIDRYVQAIGGEAALRKATSRIINMTLVIEGDDVTASFESYSQAPNKKVGIGQVKLSNGAMAATAVGMRRH
jgi:hypothetical protein